MQGRFSRNAVIVGVAFSVATACNPQTDRAGDVAGFPRAMPTAADNSASRDPAKTVNLLTVDRRAVYMSAHVAAGLALYRAGEPEAAAPHLMHPVSEMHAAERKGFDALGFDPDIFEAVSAALADGRPATEIESLLARAEENLKTVRMAAGGDAKELIAFLMKTAAFEYDAGVRAGEIVNAGEFQDAYGFAVVARELALGLDSEAAGDLVLELELLVRMWPSEGPISGQLPAPEVAMAAQISRVTLALALLP